MSSATFNTSQTHYEVLNLTFTATLAEIKTAYRRLQLVHHPDKTRSLPPAQQALSAQLSKAANEAYEVLGSDEARRRYDRSIPAASRRAAKTSPSAAPTTPAAPATTTQPPHQPAPPQFQAAAHTASLASPAWDVHVTISSRFTCAEWTLSPTSSFASPFSSSFQLVIKLDPSTTAGAPDVVKDVTLSVLRAPNGQTVESIRSLYRQLGASQAELVIDVALSRAALSKKALKRLARAAEPWAFAFDVEAPEALPVKVGRRAATHLCFFRDLPGEDAEVECVARVRGEGVKMADLRDGAVRMVEGGEGEKVVLFCVRAVGWARV